MLSVSNSAGRSLGRRARYVRWLRVRAEREDDDAFANPWAEREIELDGPGRDQREESGGGS
jgi:hypothetical protein